MKTLLIFLLFAAQCFGALTERYVSSLAGGGGDGSSGSPWTLAEALSSAASGDHVNVKTDGTYTISTPGVSITQNGPIFMQGYTSTIRDGGKATIQGDATGASYNVINSTGDNWQWQDFIFTKNGSTGSATWYNNASGAVETVFVRCVWHDVMGAGHYNLGMASMVECEAYDCNKANSSGSVGGINLNLSGSTFIRSYCHDNTSGANAHGFVIDGGVLIYQSISESNAGSGYYSTGDTTATAIQNEFYNNTRSGIFFNPPATDMLLTAAGNNFVNNTRYGFEFGTSQTCNGTFLNNGFGSGTQANDLGNIEAMEGIEMRGQVDYAADVTPWNDPANGDFKITLTAAKGTGRGNFLQIAASYAGTIGYPDIGANQHAE